MAQRNRKTENILFHYPVESIRRKFARRKDVAGTVLISNDTTKQNKFFGGARKTYWRAGYGATEMNYTFFKTARRTGAPSAEELELRQIFVAANNGRNHILHDLSQITRVQMLFEQAVKDFTKKINGVSAHGYGLNGWVMAVQYAGKKNDETGQYDVNTFPNAFDA